MKKLIYILILSLCFLIQSCHQKENYPQLLVNVDTLLNKGHHHSADSLLHLYKSTRAKQDEAADMYFQLLRLSVDNKLLRPLKDLNAAQKLVDYYTSKYKDKKLAYAYLILGDTYQNLSNVPKGLAAFLRALGLAKETKNSRLEGWIYWEMGNLYMSQGLFCEMTKCYQPYYRNIVASKDSSQLSSAMVAVSRIYKSQNKISQSVYFLRRAIQFAEKYDQGYIWINSRVELARIFIENAQYDKALALLGKESDFNMAWAEYYQATHQYELADAHYKKVLSNDSIGTLQDKSLSAKMLYSIYRSHNNIYQADSYLAKYEMLQDSIEKISNRDSLEQVISNYYYKIAQDDLICLEDDLFSDIFFIMLVVAILFSVALYKLKKNQWEVELLLCKEHKRYLYAEGKERISQQQIKKYEKEIAMLKSCTGDRNSGEKNPVHSVLMENPESKRKQIQTLFISPIKENINLEESEIYQYIHTHMKDKSFSLELKDWDRLHKLLDTNSQFTMKLKELADLTFTEFHICYLVRIQVRQAAVARIMNMNPSTVNMTCKRIYEKLTNNKGLVEDFYQFLSRL